MLVEFKPKESSSRKEDAIIDNLMSFLLNDSVFFYITFSVLAEQTQPMETNEVNEIIHNDNYYEFIKESSNIDKYIKLMSEFYNISLDDLNYRRGRLLEKVISNRGPASMVEKFDRIEEAQIFVDGCKMSDKDIDIVFKYNDIELHECKAGLLNFLNPLGKRGKDKIELMERTKKIVESEKQECTNYLVTYSSRKNPRIKRILNKHNFNTMNIFTGKEIISYWAK
ncbi:hypothetical protein [Clostridium combesii]|uniref:Uncharacterized protein n=1 Tax=Clostridium combesii TaxID=39481 RepID=A0A2G7HJC6_9CLOT|nr:hypothetical protein [Clostridium combesii]PIH05230.1 hypothetical protein CS538_05215 [Clostridium combesii]